MIERRTKPHFNVTAGLLWRDDKLLITKRPEGRHLGGLWEFPGGKQEAGETLRQCIEREIREELGIEIKAEGVLTAVHHEYETKRITLHVFQCVHLKGQPRALEGQETRWVYPDELPKYAFPPADLKVIELLTAPGERAHCHL